MKTFTSLLLAGLLLGGGATAQTLVAHYSFNTGTISGSTVQDQSGNGHHGTIYGPTPVVPGQPGAGNMALSFNGISSYVQIPSSPQFNLSSWTMSAQIKLNNYAPQSTSCQVSKIIHRGVHNGTDHMALEISDNEFVNDCNTQIPSHMRFYGDAAGPNGAYLMPSTNGHIQLSTWYCLTAVYRNDTMRNYVNGVLVSILHWPNAYQPGSNAPLYLGRGFGGGNYAYWFNGLIDDIQIWSGARFPDPNTNTCAVPTAPCTISDVKYSSSFTAPMSYTFTPVAAPGLCVQWKVNGSVVATTSAGAGFPYTFPNSGNYTICARGMNCATQVLCPEEICFSMCVDTNGQANLAAPPVRTIQAGPAVGDLYPNPGNDAVNVPVSNYTGAVNVTVYGIRGELVYKGTAQLSTNSGLINVNTSALKPGSYIVELGMGSETVRRRFSKL